MKTIDFNKGNRQAGFTLLEMLVVIAILAILAAIAAPGWLGFLDRRRLSNAQDKVYQSMRDAQVKAQQRSEPWQFSVRDGGDGLEIATHRAAAAPSVWEPISGGNALDIDVATTTIPNTAGTYFVSFDHKGNVSDDSLAGTKLVLSGENSGVVKRSVEVNSLIGTIRKISE